MFPSGPQAACVSNAPKVCLAFSLRKDIIIKGLSKPFLMKKDESQGLKWTLHEENTNFFITKLRALQVQIRHGSVFTTQVCQMLCWDFWGNLWFTASSSGWGPKHRSLISFCQQLTDRFLPQTIWKQGITSSFCWLCWRAGWCSPKTRYSSFLALSLYNHALDII